MDPTRSADPQTLNPCPAPMPGGRRGPSLPAEEVTAAPITAALSDSILRLPDDLLLFDSDPDFAALADLDLPTLSDDSTAEGVAAGEHGWAPPPPSSVAVVGSHLRILSIDSAFLSGLHLKGPTAAAADVTGGGRDRAGAHLRSSSVAGPSSAFDGEPVGRSDFVKKAMSDDKLAQLALIDPKRVKRVLANRQSADRSKARRIQYTNELERKVQTLQTEAATLSLQLTQLQKDTADLTAENRELRVRLEAMEQEAKLRDALNETLRQDVQRLKIATGQVPKVKGKTFSPGIQQALSLYLSHQQQLHNYSGNHAKHLHGSQPPSNGQSLNKQSPHPPTDVK